MLTFNGSQAFRAVVREPRVGIWWADVVADVAPSSVAVELDADGAAWRGVVVAGDVVTGAWYGRIAGAAAARVTARFYRNAPVRVVATEIATAAGLTLSSTCDASVLARVLTSWARLGGDAFEALGVLVDTLGCTWRVLRDGTLWIGSDSWPAVSIEVRTIALFPGARRVMVTADGADLRPGVSFGGVDVQAVTHWWSADGYRADVFHG